MVVKATTLGQIAKLIRSKNAGPFWITFDILFDSDEDYQRVVASNVVNKAWVADTYTIQIGDIVLVNLAAARAIKFSFPRKIPQGNPGETDMYSGQQYAPLLDLVIQTEF